MANEWQDDGKRIARLAKDLQENSKTKQAERLKSRERRPEVDWLDGQ